MSKPPIKKKYVETPEAFLELWEEYKQYVDSNPDLIEEITNKGVVVKKVKMPYLRQGFEAYVYRNYGFHIQQYFKNQDGLYGSYIPVITHIRSEFENDQIGGTLTGRYKAPNLVARLNGLVEKAQTDNTITVKIDGSDNISA